MYYWSPKIVSLGQKINKILIKENMVNPVCWDTTTMVFQNVVVQHLLNIKIHNFTK